MEITKHIEEIVTLKLSNNSFEVTIKSNKDTIELNGASYLIHMHKDQIDHAIEILTETKKHL